MKLSLIVLRSPAPGQLADFYSKIGLSVKQEKHGDGPTHFSLTLESGVIEIYPTQSPSPITFGIIVSDLEKFNKMWLNAGGSKNKSESLLKDPDGNLLHVQHHA